MAFPHLSISRPPYVPACYVASVVSNSETLCTIASQASLSMGFSRQEYWSDCHAHLQGIFLTQGWSPDLPHSKQILYHLSQLENIGTQGMKMSWLRLYRKQCQSCLQNPHFLIPGLFLLYPNASLKKWY